MPYGINYCSRSKDIHEVVFDEAISGRRLYSILSLLPLGIEY